MQQKAKSSRKYSSPLYIDNIYMDNIKYIPYFHTTLHKMAVTIILYRSNIYCTTVTATEDRYKNV